jgi:uncharacterized membrane protein YfcA
VGVGGGVVLVPVLLYLYPDSAPVWIGSVSMWMVALNATSGSITYYFKKTIHLRAAFIFILASLPGGWLGVEGAHYVDRSLFEKIFGGVMMAFGLFLFFRGPKKKGGEITAATRLDMAFYTKGAAISFAVGFVASFLGIGGGIIHVPLLAHVLGFPVHLATGTSHLILACTAWFTSAVHLWNGDVSITDPTIWQVGLAAAAGAQLGAYLSPRVSGVAILRILAAAVFLVGIRLISH